MEFNTNPNCKELIKSGICKADCCGCSPMPERYFIRLKHLIPKNKEYNIFSFKIGKDRFKKALTPDFKCAFLDDNCSCVIHDSHLRPEICQKFGLDKQEPLLACPHINDDKKEFISDYADMKLEKYAKLQDPAALELIGRRRVDE